LHQGDHYFPLSYSERQQHARLLEEVKAESANALARVVAEKEEALRNARVANLRAAEAFEAQLAGQQLAAAAAASTQQRVHEEAITRLDQRYQMRAAEHEAAITSMQAQLAAARQEVLDLSERMQSAAANHSAAHMETVMRLESKLAATGSEHQRLMDEAAAAASRRLLAATAERDETIRGLQRTIALQREESDAALAAATERQRVAVAEAQANNEAMLQALQSRLDSAAEAHNRQVEEVTRRLMAHAEHVDEEHAAALRAWRAREAALERALDESEREKADIQARAEREAGRQVATLQVRCCSVHHTI
jgi:hypothetical protein